MMSANLPSREQARTLHEAALNGLFQLHIGIAPPCVPMTTRVVKPAFKLCVALYTATIIWCCSPPGRVREMNVSVNQSRERCRLA